MAGTGYNIPISVSAASTLSIPFSFNDPTYFNNNSAGTRYGNASSQADPLQPATATSAAAEGNAAANSAGSGVATGLGAGSAGAAGGMNMQTVLIAVSILMSALILFRHK